MKDKKKLIIIMASFIVVMIGAYALYNHFKKDIDSQQIAADSSQEQELQEAPDFLVYDAEGNSVHLKDFTGRPLVVNFWASWCQMCLYEMPGFEEKYKELGDDVTFMMVNMTTSQKETRENAQAFLKENGYTFPVYYDDEGYAMYVYSVTGLPTTYFIDADGKLTAMASGAIDEDTLQRGIDMITKKQ